MGITAGQVVISALLLVISALLTFMATVLHTYVKSQKQFRDRVWTELDGKVSDNKCLERKSGCPEMARGMSLECKFGRHTHEGLEKDSRVIIRGTDG